MQSALALLGPEGEPVGAVIPWRGFAGDGVPPYQFRFEHAAPGGTFFVIKDFSRSTDLEWAPMREGAHSLRLTVRDANGESVQQTVQYTVSSRVTAGGPVVSPVVHPLVALYSAPACGAGVMRVRFRAAGSPWWSATPARLCEPGLSLNFHIAGMLGDTDYQMQQEYLAWTGALVRGPLLTFHTGVPDETLPGFIPIVTPNEQTSLSDSVALHAISWTSSESAFPIATDLLGRVIWYYKRDGGSWGSRANLMRPVPGGSLLMTVNQWGYTGQLLREINLAGNTLRETSALRVSEQIVAMGGPKIGAFHHEVIRLPNGHTMALASVEKTLLDTQGPGPVSVVGDAIVELDENWQVVWYWNAFEHLDTARQAVLGETCSGPGSGCPSLFQGAPANDWLHSNSIAYAPDGNLLLSMRNQDWVAKIDYRDGAGTGDVLWRLGREGDFVLDSADPFPWFSHQHDVRIDGSRIILYDNGNTRRTQISGDPSRGQVYVIDEQTMTATLELDANLGQAVQALGSAEKLANGNYHFLSGLLAPGPYSQSIELLPSGEPNFILQIQAGVYRSFRMRDLYTPRPH